MTRLAGVLEWRLITSAAKLACMVSVSSEGASWMCWLGGCGIVSCATFVAMGISCGRIHKPCALRRHWMVLPVGRVRMHSVLLNATVQLALHSGATASNNVWMSGKTCASRALVGNPFIWSSATWVDFMYCWLATCT